MKVIRDKPLRYPSGPDGKEYKRGDVFDVPSERDVKALSLVRAAVVDGDEKPKAAPLLSRAMTAEEPTQPTPTPMTTEESPLVDNQRRYRRRDMRSEP